MPAFKPDVLMKSPAAEEAAAKSATKSTVDRVVTITGYENDVMLAKDSAGRELRVSISDETKSKMDPESPNAKAAKFVGFMVDARMQKAMPVGSRAILEGCTSDGNVSAGGPESVKAKWVHRADRNAEKTIEGLITVEVYKGHLSGAQVWAPGALSPKDENGLKAFKKGFLAGMEGYEADKKARESDPEYKSKYLPKQGFQLRAVAENGVVIELAPRLDWNSAEKRPISWDDFKSTTKAFIDHIEKTHPGASVEICTYLDYAGGNMYEVSDESVLARMSRSNGRLAQDDKDREYAVLGVKGVLELSPGKYDPASGQVEGADRSIVAKVHASGPKAHVHTFVMGPNGEVRSMHPNLDARWPAGPKKDKEADASTDAKRAAAAEPSFG